MVKFVSYDGAFPNLCSGTLILNINGEDITFPPYCMNSGGRCWFDKDWNDHVTSGAWTIDIPEELEQFTDEIHTVVNSKVSWGCCGGCL